MRKIKIIVILCRQNCISQTIRHTKIVEGKFWEKIFYSHPKHIWAIRYWTVLCRVLQENSVSYDVRNTVSKMKVQLPSAATDHYLMNITVGQSFSQTVAI